MPQPSGQLATTITTKLTNFWQALVPKQQEYFATHGRYWQGIRTHDILPADGTATAPDTSKLPDYQQESWADMGLTLPSTIEVSVQVDQYDGPEGPGFVAQVYIQMGDEIWTRAQNYGPETWRQTGWVKAGSTTDSVP